MPDVPANLATKEDLQAVKVEVLAAFNTDLHAVKEELVERIHDGQTELLTAFYGFTQTVQQRFAEGDANETSLKRRMTILEKRLLEVEKRLNLPPAA